MPEIRHYKVTEPYLDIHCGLGEAPFWDEKTNTLRFVDIVKKHLHTVDLNKGPSSHEQHELPISIGTTANIEGNDEEFVFGGKAGYGVMNKRTAEWRYIKQFWTEEEQKSGKVERLRSNDGAVDVKGRYWVGTMNDPTVVDEPGPEGILFRLDPDLSLHRIKESITIPNGTSWALDNKSMFFTDSPSATITKHAYDVETGHMDHNGSTFFKCPIEGGVPDGHCQDAEGCFWVALFGTGKVVRINPEGEIIAEIELPTRCVTCPGICGEDLFITSAEEEDPKKHPESIKYQGGLFRVNIGVQGCPLNKFKFEP